jgi:tRNA-dihydrouridine synthase 1
MIGEEVEVKWFCSESQREEIYQVRVVNVKVSRDCHRTCHTLLFPSGETRKTKLLEERVNPHESEKKRKVSDIAQTTPNMSRRNSIPPHRFILAPMVGGSELAFRMLCRRYGITLAYTPMMNSELFAVDPTYRQVEFQTNPEDRPLVAHFSGNNPEVMLAAARHVEHLCDAIDLNLGCPQRIAHSGHFGSYLLGQEDRDLVLRIVRTLSASLSIPVFVKIRLLDTVEETFELCCQLRDAGAALIAIHGRYRVNLVGRTGPGARDGPAHLDQACLSR